MHTKGYGNIPSELFYYITFLTRALPLRSAKTFIELLMDSLLTQSGFVTSAIWILDMARQNGPVIINGLKPVSGLILN